MNFKIQKRSIQFQTVDADILGGSPFEEKVPSVDREGRSDVRDRIRELPIGVERHLVEGKLVPVPPSIRGLCMIFIELYDEAVSDRISPKTEITDELQSVHTSLSTLAAEQRRTLQVPMGFELMESNNKDELRAIIKEMGLEWEKVDR